ncbi:uncharacterized protein EI90DRAFT_3023370 [Cantharellus anzutake]|uniref:uncharacterized protein n=1 Tax=Cantharellus anzutake TaxID=1750568 RepID=UPI001906781D|nr:uncharacterized protein EI90DRAFT_3023370 [Cantharellus anzutake]KAF8311794.1 hypothetical protein EI90DRAFT_3023370 [Cantharellus anzutake]
MSPLFPALSLNNNPGRDMHPITETNAFFEFTGTSTSAVITTSLWPPERINPQQDPASVLDITIYQLQIIPTSLTISSAFAYRGLRLSCLLMFGDLIHIHPRCCQVIDLLIWLGRTCRYHSTQAFLEEFRFGSSSVRDVSAELDHRVKVLKATGGFSSVYATDGPHQVPRPFECVTKNYGHFPAHLTREVRIWKELWHPNILEFIGYAIAGERSDMKAILVSKWCANRNVVQYLRAHPNSSRTDLVVGMANGLHHFTAETLNCSP